jgi:hypothetical protein
MANLQKKSHAIQTARRRLAKATRFAEIKQIRARAGVLRLQAKSGGDLKLVRLAAELKLCAERKLGEFLSTTVQQGGDRTPAGLSQMDQPGLDSLGISRMESSRWQREASVPERRFRQYLRAAAREGIEPTAVGLLRLAERGRTGRTTGPYAELIPALRSLAKRGKSFACILVAPRDEALSSRQLRELAKLPVASIAAARAHLHLWIVPEALENGIRLLDAWGFLYASSLACATAPGDGGDYWRRAHRNLLLGVRGELGFRNKRIPSSIADRAITPNGLRQLIERVSPGPRLDLFGTKASAGWKLIPHRRANTTLAR